MVLRVDARDPDPVAMSRAAAILRDGGLVAFPTDTVYGLAVDPRQDDAVERLYDAKGRERGMAIPLIAGRIEQALEAARLGARERRLAEAFRIGRRMRFADHHRRQVRGAQILHCTSADSTG